MIRRTEYPRPQFVRRNWINLNGTWRFAFDDEDRGRRERWYRDKTRYNRTIEVPFVFQSDLSGIGEREFHDIVWYQRDFEVERNQNQRVIIHFGAVDYEADVYVNEGHVCHHTGGHTSFEADITDYLLPGGRQTVSVRVWDSGRDESIPRGKQFWEEKSRGIWYTSSTGIWQTVWLEVVESRHIRELYLTPLYDEGKIKAELEVAALSGALSLDYEISFRKEKVAAGRIEVLSAKVSFVADLFQEHIFRMNYHGESWAWTPETPNLFDLRLILRDRNEILDEVSSYFGMRKIETKNGMIYLNHMPYYQKLVLDQGYWKEGLLTAPSDRDYEKDIRLAKEMGFNGCRKHQKTEDPRFLYWADMLGYLVWGECAAPAVFNRNSVERLMSEWKDIIRRDYNHPCIVTWVPVNESWGVPDISFDRRQQHFSQALYHYLHTLDPSRPVISNDGWAVTETDIVGIHNYAHGQEGERERQQYFEETLSCRENLIHRNSSPWPVFAEGFSYGGEPIVLTEFGGIAYDVSGERGWGYTSAETEQVFLQEYRRIMEAVCRSKALWGYCYTQLTDVEQEINGLLTYDRKPKCDLAVIREINNRYHVSVVE